MASLIPLAIIFADNILACRCSLYSSNWICGAKRIQTLCICFTLYPLQMIYQPLIALSLSSLSSCLVILTFCFARKSIFNLIACFTTVAYLISSCRVRTSMVVLFKLLKHLLERFVSVTDFLEGRDKVPQPVAHFRPQPGIELRDAYLVDPCDARCGRSY